MKTVRDSIVMDLRLVGAIFFILLVLGLGSVIGSTGFRITLVIDSRDEVMATILAPGEHLLTLGLSNEGGETIQPSVLTIYLSKHHEGLVWNTSRETPSLGPNQTCEFNITLGTHAPGLYTITAELEGQMATATRTLEVSYTSDRWQEWRSKREIPNKTHLLLGFYYPWYGTPEGPCGTWHHWVPQREYDSTHVPLVGFYDSLSEDVIRYHVRTAQSVGFDGFISSWWGPGNYIDDAFPRLLDIAGETGFKATIYFEIARDRDHLYNQLRYVLTRYGNHSAFLRWDGRPVIFIYGRVISDFELTDFARVFEQLESEGLPAFYLADRLDTEYLQVFDGLHTYILFSGMDRYVDLSPTCTGLGKIFAATVVPGYDDTIIRDPGRIVDRANGTYYRDFWETIMLSKPDWVLVTSWNEWHEGSEIEPSLEFGDLYLNLTLTYYELFEAGMLTPGLEARLRQHALKLLQEFERMIQNGTACGADMSSYKTILANAWSEYLSGDYSGSLEVLEVPPLHLNQLVLPVETLAPDYIGNWTRAAGVVYVRQLLELTSQEIEGGRALGIDVSFHERLLELAGYIVEQGNYLPAEGYCNRVLDHISEEKAKIPEALLSVAFTVLGLAEMCLRRRMRKTG